MIVVIGVPSLRAARDVPAADGLVSRIALAAASAGGSVQLVGKVGDDPAGDAVLIDLGRRGVGHAALLRDPANPTRILPEVPPDAGDGRIPDVDDLLEAAQMLDGSEPESEGAVPAAPIGPAPALEAADLELGLRYLVEFGVVVAVDPLDEGASAVVAEAAAYVGARVVALVAQGASVPMALAGATVLEVPLADPDGAFARLVAGYAIALDGGTDAEAAFRMAAEGGGWEPVVS